MNNNPYEILHLSEDATYDEIKERYRHLTIHLHPDKQPLANYQLAHKHFKEIDEAYKSISSQLRRFVFKEFGSPGIIIMSMYPYLFKQFEESDLANEPDTQTKIKLIIFHLLHEQHASAETEQKNLRIMSVIILWWPLNKERILPNIERCDFQYEMPLPPLYGFTQTLKISQSSRGLTNASKSVLEANLGISKRIYNSVLMIGNLGVNSESVDVNLGANWVINQRAELFSNLLKIRFQDNRQYIAPPEVGITFQQNDLYYSSRTDFHETSFEVGTSGNPKDGKKTLKFGFEEDGAVKMTPTYQKQLTKNLRFFIQYDVFLKNDGFGNSIFYGYRLKTSKEMGLFFQLASYIDFSQNSRFQFSIITPKYKVTFPFLSKASFIEFQLFKICVLGATFLLFKLYYKVKSKTKQEKNKLFHDNYNRLMNDKNTVNKMNGQISIPANISLQKQIELSGLIVINSYYGKYEKIQEIHEKYQKYIQDYQVNHRAPFSKESIKFFEDKERDDHLIEKEGDKFFQDQVYKITNIIQANVVGAQLKGVVVSQLNINPCINEFQNPYSLIIYHLRGKLQMKIFKHNQQVKIGSVDYSQKHPWYLKAKNKIVKIYETCESMISSA